MIVMQSMELDDEDKLDAPMPIAMPDKPDFPYGLRICLSEKELAKLNLDVPEAEHIGGIVHGHFMARVTSVSTDQRDGETCCRVELQIEDLAIESEDTENEDD
jgi:hypothetical protein